MRQERDCQAFSKEKGGRDPVFSPFRRPLKNDRSLSYRMAS